MSPAEALRVWIALITIHRLLRLRVCYNHGASFPVDFTDSVPVCWFVITWPGPETPPGGFHCEDMHSVGVDRLEKFSLDVTPIVEA